MPNSSLKRWVSAQARTRSGRVTPWRPGVGGRRVSPSRPSTDPSGGRDTAGADGAGEGAGVMWTCDFAWTPIDPPMRAASIVPAPPRAQRAALSGFRAPPLAGPCASVDGTGFANVPAWRPGGQVGHGKTLI